MRTQLPDLLHGEGEKKKVEVSNQTFLEQRKLARKWTCLYLTYDLLQNHFYTHFFSLVMLSSLEVKNIKERKGERTLICSEQLAEDDD